MTLFARTLAVTAVVDHAMSVWNMMITPVVVVNNVFCTPTECLVPLGTPGCEFWCTRGIIQSTSSFIFFALLAEDPPVQALV